MEEILNIICLHLGVFNWTLFNGVVEELNSFLFGGISVLEPGNQLFLLLFQQISGVRHLLSFVVSILNTRIVE